MNEEYIKQIFNECHVGKLLGIEVLDVREGFARGKLNVKNEHINLFGGIHGGILFTFADHVGGACGNSMGKKAVLVQSTTHFIKSAFEGDTIFAEATCTHKGRNVDRIDIKVSRENGDVIALMHMISFVKDESHEPKTVENI